MHIAEIFRKEFIIDDLKAKNKRGVLAELSGIFTLGPAKVDSKLMVDVLMEREKLGSTGIGDGIAIPHGKLKGLETRVMFERNTTVRQETNGSWRESFGPDPRPDRPDRPDPTRWTPAAGSPKLGPSARGDR